MQRRRLVAISPDQTLQLFVAAPEDLILQKLLWFRAGGDVSDRQWRDVLGLLKVQGARLDWAILNRWADRLGIEELLDRARAEAGVRLL